MFKKTSIDYLQLAGDIHQEMIARRKDFHMHPEIGFEVHRTAGIVARQLVEYGLVVKTDVGKTGVVADLFVPGATSRVALRADMDALPIQELNDVPYKSCIPMRAHMCGHDAHTAMLLGAAKILANHRDKLTRHVRFIFQPSEEIWPGGAPGMIQEGALKEVDEIYALHVWPTLQVGHYGICVGPTMAQADGFDIIITGKGGHAASPQSVIDPIVIAGQVVQALQTIVSRNVNPNDNAVVTITQIHAGSSYNVIPDSCTIAGTVRTYDPAVQQLIRRRIDEIVQGIVKANNGQGFVKYLEGYPPLFNHQDAALAAKDIALSLVGEQSVDFPAQKVMFGEDFAYYAKEVKGCFIHLGCRNAAKGFTHLLHEPLFDIDEECLVYGAALHVALGSQPNGIMLT
jgi:amidohydrolase